MSIWRDKTPYLASGHIKLQSLYQLVFSNRQRIQRQREQAFLAQTIRANMVPGPAILAFRRENEMTPTRKQQTRPSRQRGSAMHWLQEREIPPLHWRKMRRRAQTKRQNSSTPYTAATHAMEHLCSHKTEAGLCPHKSDHHGRNGPVSASGVHAHAQASKHHRQHSFKDGK